MEPKRNQTTGGEQAALIIRHADFSGILERLDRMDQSLAEIRDFLPLKRRKLSRATKRAHIGCILSWYEGKCPCCRETRIIGENGSILPSCNEEHYVNRHENALDKTWLVCQDCNQRKTTGKVAHTDVEALFRAYQVTLKKHLAEERGPVQMKVKDSGRLCALFSTKNRNA